MTLRRGHFLSASCAAAFAAAAAPSCAWARGLGGGEDFQVSLSRIVLAFLICIAVAVLAILLIRQRAGKGDLQALFSRVELRQRAIQVVETRRVSQHGDICLVRHAGREYLLVVLAGHTHVLNERDIDIASQREASA